MEKQLEKRLDKQFKCSYSAPLSYVLAGSPSQFDAHLLCAQEERIVVTMQKVLKVTKPHPLREFIDVPEGFDWSIQSHKTTPGVVGAVLAGTSACILHFHHGHANIQSCVKIAHEWERSCLKDQARAYALCSLTGGLIFYRKEFPTHTTLIQFPFHVPYGWDMGGEALDYSDQDIRRLVFSIQREHEHEFRKLRGSSLPVPIYASKQGCVLTSPIAGV